MRAFGRVLGDVAGYVGPPTLPRRAVILQGRKYDYVTIENTGFVSPLQRPVGIDVLNEQVQVLNERIQKLLVLRKFDGSSFAKQFFHLLVGERRILFWKTHTVEPQDFVEYVLLVQSIVR